MRRNRCLPHIVAPATMNRIALVLSVFCMLAAGACAAQDGFSVVSKSSLWLYANLSLQSTGVLPFPSESFRATAAAASVFVEGGFVVAGGSTVVAYHETAFEVTDDFGVNCSLLDLAFVPGTEVKYIFIIIVVSPSKRRMLWPFVGTIFGFVQTQLSD